MRSKAILIVPLVLTLTLLLITPASALFLPTNEQAATLVLGQPDFTSTGCGLGSKGVCLISRVAVDPTTGKIFVADSGNNRVLRFSSVTKLSNGAGAEAVLGQPNFATNSPQTTQDGMDTPRGVAVDANGSLWVADVNNSRVLRFDNAATKLDGANADGVLGQPDFTSKFDLVICTTSAGLMCFPQDVAVDSSGRLWVADAENNRVLRFDNPAAKPNGGDADGVLGQPDFTTRGCGSGAGAMCDNFGLTVDSSGRLWVSDLEYMRVLRFDNAAAKPNGADADGVLGQPDFTSGGTNLSQNGVNHPDGLAVDTDGRLYVADVYNGRILIFNHAASLPNGANASYELGQPDFTTFNTGPISDTNFGPEGQAGVFFDPAAKVLWAPAGDRILMFGQPYATLHIMPFIGRVNYFLPPGVTPIGSISIRTRDGSLYTFDVLPNTRILPERRSDKLGAGSFVALQARYDLASAHLDALSIGVLHTDSAPPGFPTEIPTETPTPVGVPTSGP